MLLAGVRGRRRNRYQVLSTDANGQVRADRAGWMARVWRKKDMKELFNETSTAMS